MSHRSKPRGGPKSARSPSSGNSLHGRANGGGNGDGRRVVAGKSGARPSNGSANGGSPEKTLLEQAGETARNAPEVREELVAHYRKLLAEGRYHPDPEAVAERMIRKGLLRDI